MPKALRAIAALALPLPTSRALEIARDAGAPGPWEGYLMLKVAADDWPAKVRDPAALLRSRLGSVPPPSAAVVRDMCPEHPAQPAGRGIDCARGAHGPPPGFSDVRRDVRASRAKPGSRASTAATA